MQDWSGLLLVACLVFVAIIIFTITSINSEKKLIKSGVLPPPNETTDADIVKLASSGYKVWAIKRYRQLHKVSLKEAKSKIEAMQS
mgnify:CR=1 FL=1